MKEGKFYTLPMLPYEYDALEPAISKEQLTIHHDKHHQVYVENANKILEEFDTAHRDKKEIDFKSSLKALSFNIGGHLLHSLFWDNLSPKSESEDIPIDLKNVLEQEYGSAEQFKAEFSKTAFSVEGSGWAALVYCKLTQRPLLMQIEKHNVNVYPAFQFLLVLDVWEHAYYIDYKNDRKKFIDSFWDIINWNEVNRRFQKIKGEQM